MASSDGDLGHLEKLLAALPQANMPMTVSELDGYVTGILACPELILPSEWLPHVWGEAGDAEFPDLATAQETVGAVMAHYNAVANHISRSPLIEAVYERDINSDDVLWEPWVDGFNRAIRLRPKAWEHIIEKADAEARSALIYLFALQNLYEGNSKFSDDEVDAIDAEAPDLIPNCVASVLRAARPKPARQADNLNRPDTSGKQPVRNDPCPCGSALKYKKYAAGVEVTRHHLPLPSAPR